MPPFYVPTAPADPELYNAACDAGIDFAAGLVSEDYYLATMALYQRAEREQLERAWQTSFN
jgi:hypothetical protein